MVVSEERAAEAFAAYSRGEYAAAVALYLAAHDAAPSGSILYNIARIYDTKLADRPLAITFYRRYIADPGAYTERIELANQRLKELRDAELQVARLAEPGSSAAAEPAPPARALPELPGGDAGGRDEGWSSLRWTGAVVGALGLVGVGTGAVFGLSAMSRADTARDSCDGNACTSQRGVDAAGAARDDATISNVAFTAGGALLVTGTALFLLGATDSPSEQSHGVRWQPQTTASGASLLVSGKW